MKFRIISNPFPHDHHGGESAGRRVRGNNHHLSTDHDASLPRSHDDDIHDLFSIPCDDV
ncbi:MAG: hypothetical protein OEV64_06760 [Desulfobulbaceae bacterium]|nr:hypothetical protein [Desulfobulbaceae bacterium]